MNSNFIKRTVTGILFVAILVGCILSGTLSFGILFVVISSLTIFEYGQLINNRAEGANVNKFITMLGGAYLFLAIMAFCINTADSKIFIPYIVLLLYLMISELYLKKENPLLNWAYSMLSQLYIGLPFALLNILAFHTDPEYSSVSYNPILPLSIFIFLWLNDTGAYCIGSLIGRHRLFERISPKKSWEGFPFLSMWEWAGLALTVVIFGTWGDLTESLLKRQLHVKDSGTILPGHGGLLDRFDSSLMAIPAAVVYLYVLTLL